MSQIFNKDAQFSANAGTIAQAAITALLTTNFITPPFGNCKAVIKGIINVQPDAACTTLEVFIFRNPNAENVQVGAFAIVFAAAAATSRVLPIMCTDQIPDGRDVQYRISAQQFTAGGASAAAAAFIEAQLISG